MSSTVSFTLEKGMINIADPIQVSEADIDPRKKLIYKALVDCRNIDLDNNGKGKRRLGETSTVAGNFRSGWNTPDGKQAYAMRDGNLVSFNGSAVTVMQAGLSTTRDMVFEPGVTMYRGGASTINVVCFTNNEVYGMISGGRVVSCVSSDEDFKYSMPPGQCLCEGGGRMYVATGPNVTASEPYDMESRDERFDTIPFDKDVTMMRRADTSIFVSTTERIYWHPGLDLTQKDLEQKQPHYAPAIPGCSMRVPSELLGLKGLSKYVAVWASEGGVCIGSDTGEIINVSADRISYAPGKRVAMMLRQQNGLAHFVITMLAPGTAKNKFTSRLFT